MSVQFVMPNGEIVPVPRDVVSQGNAAQQSFYDLQLKRIETEDTSYVAAPATPEKE